MVDGSHGWCTLQKTVSKAWKLKSVASSLAKPYHMVLAASDQYVRLYDRRMQPRFDAGGDAHSSWTAAHTNVLRYSPLHLAPDSTIALSGLGIGGADLGR